MAKRRRREIPVDSVCLTTHLLLLYDRSAGFYRPRRAWVTLAGIRDTEDEPMPASIEVDT
jgi:hypothetical protein